MSRASQYRFGAQKERDVVELLDVEGWVCGRAAGSRGSYDIMALRAGDQPMLIQVKAGKLDAPWGRFPPKEREALVRDARKAGAKAVACFWKIGERGPRFVNEEDWPKPRRPDHAE